MDSIVFEGTPLAAYLEGEGDTGVTTVLLPKDGPNDEEHSFAPRGPSTIRSRFRRSLPNFNAPSISSSRVATRISEFLSAKPSGRENDAFLEQFRYMIIASQLLGGPINSFRQRELLASNKQDPLLRDLSKDLSTEGVALTASGAFFLVWILYWGRGGRTVHFSKTRCLVTCLVLAFIGTTSMAQMKRQMILKLRDQVLQKCSEFVAVANSFDGVMLSGLSFIQEIEVVSRGYRMNSPLPPVSRLDETSEIRRCNRLRKALSDALKECLEPFAQAYDTLQNLANEIDMERYFDIYEIAAAQLEEIKVGADSSISAEDVETLQALKESFRHVHILRKVILCTLLALSSDGGRIDYLKWQTTLATLKRAEAPLNAGQKLVSQILNEQDFHPRTPPKIITLDAGKERVRAQMKKLNALSLGIRGLQAKMHILREDSDRGLDESDDVTQSGQSLMHQYESIGEDLKMLMHEWETGKSALATNIDKNERRLSSMTSPTLSLGGITDVDCGSPSDALKLLNGEMSSDDEVFEAVAAPRPRSLFKREERIAKMKEDRARSAAFRESREANTHMLKELETVINLRPKRRAGGRITSI
ncbi:MAG: hypothetical protein M1814_002054 [Vezdaea aestivalis]|nr:MAG: hypothetical protein M1814_002054 [Vezdaea aestivalis]